MYTLNLITWVLVNSNGIIVIAILKQGDGTVVIIVAILIRIIALVR